MKELIALYDEYIDFLNAANETPVTIACIHGWRCQEQDVKKGVEYRLKIDDLKKQYGLMD